MDKTSKEMLEEFEKTPLVQLTRKYGHLTLGGIYELLESQTALLREALEVVEWVANSPALLAYTPAIKAQTLLPKLEEAVKESK